MPLIVGDALQVLSTLPDASVQCCVTSPPYWGMRDYGAAGQIGLEATPDQYVGAIVAVMRQVRRVLRPDGVLWVNLGDTYARAGGPAPGHFRRGTKSWYPDQTVAKPAANVVQKSLLGIPWRVAFALQNDGWLLRQDIIWHKPNPMPEHVLDRCTKAHEYLFMLTRRPRYRWDATAMQEKATGGGNGNIGRMDATVRSPHFRAGSVASGVPWSGRPTRNRRSVWTVTPKPFAGAHFAVMPEALVEPCVLATSRCGDTVLDPFCGSGTVGLVARRYGREFCGIDLNPSYLDMARQRIALVQPCLPRLRQPA